MNIALLGAVVRNNSERPAIAQRGQLQQTSLRLLRAQIDRREIIETRLAR